jgi:Putative Ig domain
MAIARRVVILTAGVLFAAAGWTVPAYASHGGGGGGGGGGGTTTPPPAGTLTISPASLIFPGEPTGVTSPPQTVTVTDTGTAPVFFNADSPRGDAVLDFRAVQDNCVGIQLAPGTSCTITITFTPTADGTRTSTFALVDNAAASPQIISVSGTGLGTGSGPTPLSIYTASTTCSAGVCSAGSTITGNFLSTMFTATGGTSPYTWSASGLPAGTTFSPSTSLITGLAAAPGDYPFTISVRDAAGATATPAFVFTVTPVPAPGDTRCQKAPSAVNEPLAGAAIGGVLPSGNAQGDESKLTACGGYTVLHVSVRNVNLPNGTVLWVYHEGLVGQIVLSSGAGSMRPYNLGGIGLRFDPISVYSTPPPLVLAQPAVVSGGSFS